MQKQALSIQLLMTLIKCFKNFTKVSNIITRKEKNMRERKANKKIF